MKSLTQYLLVVWTIANSILMGLFLFGILNFFNLSPELQVLTVSSAFLPFLGYLLVDSHQSPPVGFVGMFLILATGFISLSSLSQHLSLVILGFILGVLTFFAVNEEFDSFSVLEKVLIWLSPWMLLLLVMLMIISGVTAAAFDESTSVVLVARIYAMIMVPLFARRATSMLKNKRTADNAVLQLVFATNGGSLLFKLGHPLGLKIGAYAIWSMGFWFVYITPISLLALTVTIILSLFMFGKSFATYSKTYQEYRSSLFPRPFNIKSVIKTLELSPQKIVGLVFIFMLVYVHLHHEVFADTLAGGRGTGHEDILLPIPWFFSGLQLLVLNVFFHKHIDLNEILEKVQVAEVAIMFLIFFLIGSLIDIGTLNYTQSFVEGIVYRVEGKTAQENTAAVITEIKTAIESGLLENLGVGTFENAAVDRYGGTLNTTPIRILMLVGAAIGGNLFMFASAAGLVGETAFWQSFDSTIKRKMKQLVDDNYPRDLQIDIESLFNEHLKDPQNESKSRLFELVDKHNVETKIRNEIKYCVRMVTEIDYRVNQWYWLKRSVPLIISILVVVSSYVLIQNSLGHYPAGVWYCSINHTHGCIVPSSVRELSAH